MLGSTFYLKLKGTYITYREDQLCQTAAFTLKIYFYFWTTFATHVQRIKSILDSGYLSTEDFLDKIKKIWKLPEATILCTIDIVGLYPDIPHVEGLSSLRKFLETVVNKQISIGGSAKLAEMVLKNNIFECDKKTFTLKRKIVIGTKFSHPYFFYC